MKKTLRIFLLPFLFSVAACDDAGESFQSQQEIIPIELATTGSEGTIVVDSLKHESQQVDEDIDHDMIADASDNCPTISNQDQADENSDGIGNACANL